MSRHNGNHRKDNVYFVCRKKKECNINKQLAKPTGIRTVSLVREYVSVASSIGNIQNIVLKAY